MIRTRAIDARHSNDPRYKRWKARFRSGVLAYEEGKFDEARHVLFLALRAAEQLDESDFAVPACYLALGVLETDIGKMEQARESLAKAENLLKNQQGDDCRELYACLLRYKADWFDRNHDKAQAEKLLRESVKILRELGVDSSVQLANSLSDLCFLLVRVGRLDEAEDLILAAMDIYASTVGRADPAYDWAKMIYQICLNKQDEEALFDAFEMSATSLQYKVGAQNPHLVRALKIYAHALKERGMKDNLERARDKFTALIKH
ncbi:MAG: tetratricopeptide repeat protein [Cyanobacteria bacterium HKST-UBA02]|nr:tetratricopeptide repeat protein [Cyanobacteria bacterium HKST-UBA02]